MSLLREHLTFDNAKMEILSEEAADGKGKNLYMKGVFVQGGVKNANQRVYPVQEIAAAVESVHKQIKEGYSVLGELTWYNKVASTQQDVQFCIL